MKNSPQIFSFCVFIVFTIVVSLVFIEFDGGIVSSSNVATETVDSALVASVEVESSGRGDSEVEGSQPPLLSSEITSQQQAIKKDEQALIATMDHMIDVLHESADYIEPTPDNWNMPATGLHAEQVNLVVIAEQCDGCIAIESDSNMSAMDEFASEVNVPVTVVECQDCIELSDLEK